MGKGDSHREQTVVSPSSAHNPCAIGDFTGLYQTLLPQVRSFLGRVGVSPAAWNDLTQEVFLRAWARRAFYVPRASVKTWLLAIARNVAREWRRHRDASMSVDAEVPVEDTVAQAVAGRELRQMIQEAVAQLPPKQQQAIRLVYFDGLKPAQGAAKAGCREPVFSRRLADARVKLRRLLGGV
ncbi:MAG: RNA polymerase sigma factor [Bacillota bacterium]